MTSKGVDKRITLALYFLSLLSGNSWNSVATGDIDGNELVHLFSRMFKKQVGIFSRLLETGKSSVTKMLTVCQLVDLKVLLNLPMLSIRRMRTMFCNFGLDIYPSEHKMHEEMCGRVQHIEEADMKCEKIFLQPAGSEEGLKEIDTMFSGNLVNYIEGVFSKIKTDFYEKPDSVLKIALGGDKGGGGGGGDP